METDLYRFYQKWQVWILASLLRDSASIKVELFPIAAFTQHAQEMVDIKYINDTDVK